LRTKVDPEENVQQEDLEDAEPRKTDAEDRADNSRDNMAEKEGGAVDYDGAGKKEETVDSIAKGDES